MNIFKNLILALSLFFSPLAIAQKHAHKKHKTHTEFSIADEEQEQEELDEEDGEEKEAPRTRKRGWWTKNKYEVLIALIPFACLAVYSLARFFVSRAERSNLQNVQARVRNQGFIESQVRVDETESNELIDEQKIRKREEMQEDNQALEERLTSQFAKHKDPVALEVIYAICTKLTKEPLAFQEEAAQLKKAVENLEMYENRGLTESIQRAIWNHSDVDKYNEMWLNSLCEQLKRLGDPCTKGTIAALCRMEADEIRQVILANSQADGHEELEKILDVDYLIALLNVLKGLNHGFDIAQSPEAADAAALAVHCLTLYYKKISLGKIAKALKAVDRQHKISEQFVVIDLNQPLNDSNDSGKPLKHFVLAALASHAAEENLQALHGILVQWRLLNPRFKLEDCSYNMRSKTWEERPAINDKRRTLMDQINSVGAYRFLKNQGCYFTRSVLLEAITNLSIKIEQQNVAGLSSYELPKEIKFLRILVQEFSEMKKTKGWTLSEDEESTLGRAIQVFYSKKKRRKYSTELGIELTKFETWASIGDNDESDGESFEGSKEDKKEDSESNDEHASDEESKAPADGIDTLESKLAAGDAAGYCKLVMNDPGIKEAWNRDDAGAFSRRLYSLQQVPIVFTSDSSVTYIEDDVLSEVLERLINTADQQSKNKIATQLRSIHGGLV